MTEANTVLEQVIDDLLLTVDDVTAGNAATLTSRVSANIAELAMPAVNDYVRAHTAQRKGALRASELFAKSTSEYVAVHALLASALLAWASEQTGLSVGEVLAGARAYGKGDA